MKKIFLLVIAIACNYYLFAQRYLGVANSNWGGTNSLYLNPASIADSRERLTIDLISTNIGFDNNMGTINTGDLVNNLNKSGKIDFNNIFKYGTQKNFSMMAPYLELRGPGFTYSINNQHSIAFTTRIRTINQIDNMSQSLFRSVVDQNFGNTNGDYNLQADKFNWTAHAWGELGLSYAGVLYQDGIHQIRGGITLRYLSGIQYFSFLNNGLNINYTGASNTITASQTDLRYSTNVKNNIDYNLAAGDMLSKFFGGAAGNGVGADIGIIYDFRPDYSKYALELDGKKGVIDHSKNMYKVRLSASITDLGAIVYNKNGSSASFQGNGTIKASDFYSNINNASSIKSVLQSHGFSVDSGAGNATVHLPTSLVLGVDYRIGGNFFVNATGIVNVANRNIYGNSNYNQVTLTPRYDRSGFSFGIPITYNTLSQSMRVGMGIRIGGFFIGSDDMMALIGLNNQYGANLYMGASLLFKKHHIIDTDGDGVSDKYDQCPLDKGTWSNHGCPANVMAETNTGLKDRDYNYSQNIDTDGDGVPDSEDNCPTVAGSISNHGCPELRKDVQDKLDEASTAIEFETNEASIKSSSYGVLDEIITILEEYSGYYMTIEGHTDNVGSPEANMALSKDRANAVRNYFILRGISSSRLVAKGYGDTQPIASNKSENGRARNRRVVLGLKMKN
ncbi:MAG: DUF5723 family protein [Bacteroidota bacterium]